MSRRKAHAEAHANNERWLLTYADLITLLLIYFIVLFAMSQINVNKYHELAQAMSNAFNLVPSQGGSSNSVLPPASRMVMPPVSPMYTEHSGNTGTSRQSLAQVEHKLQVIADQSASGSLDVRKTSRGVVISVEDNALFPEGSAMLSPKALQVLDKVAAVLVRTTNHIRVEGYTDDTPIHTAEFPSNWELSTARAINVLHDLIDRGHILPSRLSAAGYGEYFPRVPNTTAANRAENRRVDIVLLRNATMAQEPSRPAFATPSSSPRSRRPVVIQVQGMPGAPPPPSSGGNQLEQGY